MTIAWAIGSSGDDKDRRRSIGEAMEKAYGYRQSGELAKAREVVIAAMSGVSGHEKAELISDLGRTHAHGGDYDEAIVCFRKALALWPEHTHTMYALASLLAYTGRLAQADALFSENIPVRAGNGEMITTATIRFRESA